MPCRETVGQDAVQRMLHAGQTLGRVVVLVVDVQVVSLHGIQDLFAQQVVVYKRLGGFAGKLHHHACRCVGIHVGVFAGDVVGLDIDDFQKHVSRLGLAGNAALVAVGNVFLGYILAAAFHQFQFHHVLNGLYGHLCRTAEGDVVRYLMDELQVFALVGMQHGLADGGRNFFFVEADDAAVALDNSLYHTIMNVWGCKLSFFDDAKLSKLSESFLFWKTIWFVKFVKSMIIRCCCLRFGKLLSCCDCFIMRTCKNKKRPPDAHRRPLYDRG